MENKSKYSLLEIIKVNTIIFIFNILLYIPMRYKIRLATFIEVLIFWLAKHKILRSMQIRYAISMTNLRLCFPHKSDKTLWLIIRASFRESTLTFLNYGYMFSATEKKLQADFIYKTSSNLFDAIASKANVILMAPHFCAFDIGLNRTSIDTSYCSIYKKVNNYFFYRLKQARLRFAYKGYKSELFSIEDGLRAVIKSMTEHKHLLCYLPDLDYGWQNSLFVKFFAYKKCAILRVVPKIARITDATIVPIMTYRRGDKYSVELLPPFKMPNESNAYGDVSQIASSICKLIAKNPSQYRWYYPIFTTHPDLPDGKLYENAIEKVFA